MPLDFTVALVLAGVLVALGVAMLLGPRRAPQERGLTPIFEASCRGSFGRRGILGYSRVTLRLSIYREFLVLGFFRPLVIPLGELSHVEVKSGVLTGQRLCFETGSGATYKLRVKNPASVAKLLRAAGDAEELKSTWVCAACGEHNPPGFEICWKCQAAQTS
jgi:hypothetical protein